MNPADIAVTTLLLGQSAFFASGHSNSFASFDLTNGFNGIESSRAVAVALQALLSNYFGPVWWSLSSLRLLLAWRENRIVTSKVSSTAQAPQPKAAGGIFLEDRSEQQLDSHVSRDNEDHAKDVVSNGQVVGNGQMNGHANGRNNGHLNGHVKEQVGSDIKGGQIKTMLPASDDLNRHKSAKSTSLAYRRNAFAEHLTLQTFYTASTSLAVLLACIWKRNDPSIWTVLTPKCLNIILWAVFQQLMVNGMFCTVIWLFVVV
jgi:hypothetical protein